MVAKSDVREVLRYGPLTAALLLNMKLQDFEGEVPLSFTNWTAKSRVEGLMFGKMLAGANRCFVQLDHTTQRAHKKYPARMGISAAWDLNECLLLHLRFVFMEASSYHFVLMEAAAFCINNNARSCIPHALCKATTTSYVIDNEGEPIPDVAEQHMVDCCIGNEADPKGRECTTSSFLKGDRFLKNVGVYKTYKTEDYGKYTS
ncbi:hypothetical protein OROMI_027573 [Orobanche minor]